MLGRLSFHNDLKSVDFRDRNAQFQGKRKTVVLNTDVLSVNCTEFNIRCF